MQWRKRKLEFLGLTALAVIVLWGIWLRFEVAGRHFHSPLHGDGAYYRDMGNSLLVKRSFELREQITAYRGFLYPGAIATIVRPVFDISSEVLGEIFIILRRAFPRAERLSQNIPCWSGPLWTGTAGMCSTSV